MDRLKRKYILPGSDKTEIPPRTKRWKKRQPVLTRTVKKWSEESEEALKDCFDTAWDVFTDSHGEDINGLTDCITDYMNFCEEHIVPTRTVQCFPNNKPWITPDIKALLKDKKRAFRSGNREELKTVQRELRFNKIPFIHRSEERTYIDLNTEASEVFPSQKHPEILTPPY
ncbi:hypothetical protein JOQ06_000173 [Pogonophryne albipinna]|uniref:Uncharacterized protein n=1 Tax=Pogonophryne albipinna TaxID=1090488 RepID=A0AAD6A9X0_9TELE|nr:hypothetical protein JOQ06_000173 [Pogonophryne albipinna]